MKKIVIIVQARMGSTRLPGKLLLEVLGRPLLSYQIERLRRVKGASQLVVATTLSSGEAPLLTCCEQEGIEVFRGSEEDVLGRYAEAARRFEADVVVRITADCPLIDPQIVERMIAFFQKGKYDYASNVLQRTFPRGMDVEIFSSDKLYEADRLAIAAYEREHVTPFFYEHPERYTLGGLKNEQDLSAYRWTVDTPEDFRLIKAMIETVYPVHPEFTLNDLLAACDRHPEWAAINASIVQKPMRK